MFRRNTSEVIGAVGQMYTSAIRAMVPPELPVLGENYKPWALLCKDVLFQTIIREWPELTHEDRKWIKYHLDIPTR